MIPSYEDLKLVKEHKEYILFFPPFGGYFRLVVNEDEPKNIAVDYLYGGYLSSVNYTFDSEYHFNRLYKLNKKNYQGLVKLYKKMLKTSKEKFDSYILELEGGA